MDGTVIVADDDKNLRAVLTQSLTRAGAKVRATATLSTLWRWLEEGEGDVVLCDVNLADGDSLLELPKMRAMRPDLQFVLMSAQNTVITALRAEEAGAFDYLAKPFDLREMIEVLMRAQSQIQAPKTPQREDADFDLPLIGRSEEMQEVYRHLAKIIPSHLPVLITGETGTGKSLMADVIHRYGPRKALPLERYDGSGSAEITIAETFMAAGEGTVIIDKVEDLLPSEQRDLLHEIEAGQHAARVIAIAPPHIESLIEEGRVRLDLFHVLNVLALPLPNLRDHVDDIDELARHFVAEESRGRKSIDDDAIQLLKTRQWQGNVKALQAAMKRLVAMSNADWLSAADVENYLPRMRQEVEMSGRSQVNFSQNVEVYVRRFLKLHGENLPPNGFYNEIIDQVDRPLIEVVLEATAGNQIKAAQILGINRNTLRKKIQNLDISVTKGKKLM